MFKRPDICQKVYSRLAPWLSTAVVCGVFFERYNSFAQSQSPSTSAATTKAAEDSPVPPLGEINTKRLESVKKKEEACRLFEGKIITFYDQSSLIQNCKQRSIENADVLNALSKMPGRSLHEVPARIYRLIPFGEPFTAEDLPQFKVSPKEAERECARLDGNYVTVSGSRYYFIDKCKKHLFSSYFDVESHNKFKKPIVTVQEETLDKIASGPDIKIKKSEYDVLYRIDGDSNWSKLSRSRLAGDPTASDSPESLEKVDQQSRKAVNKGELCKQFNKKIISYYSQIYFIDNCSARLVKDFTVRYQQRVDELGGIVDLTSEQIAVIPKGKDISAADAVSLIR